MKHSHAKQTRISMQAICLYFQVHQPFRVKEYTFYNIGIDKVYEAVDQNYLILNKVADRCYLPANRILLELIEQHKGKFKVAFSFSGIVLEQFQLYRPQVIESFKALVDTGCVEILAETYYHSLSSVYHPEEFKRQVKLHGEKVKELFGVTPTTFRNTELIYSDAIAEMVADMGYTCILAEGADQVLKGTSPTRIFSDASERIKVLTRHYRLSDDIAFRFPDKNWSEYPLTPMKFANWVKGIGAEAQSINLFMDYETFGEHKAAETGIFDFLLGMPSACIEAGIHFQTPAEISAENSATAIYNAPEVVTWADEDRNLAGWVDSYMQQDAIKRIYDLEKAVLATSDSTVLHQWGKLQTSDHFYYMSTRYWGDGVRTTFSPYKSPYDGYINYMNVLTDFEERIDLVSEDSK